MRLPRLEDALIACTALDSLLAASALAAGGRPGLAALIPLAAIGLVFWYLRSSAAAALACLVGVLFIVPQAVLILSRPAHSPVQDGLLVTEAAAGRVVAGLDPYGHDYLGNSALRSFWAPEFPVNPLLSHFPYPPGMILLGIPFHSGGLDLAWLWLLALPALAAAAWLAAGRAGVVVTALNPLLLLDYLYLFNDLVFLAAAVASTALLFRRRPLLAGAFFGASLLLKQQALLFLPLLAVLPGRGRFLAAAGIVVAAGILPFLVWSPEGFLADTAAYFYGSGTASFPIRGPGLPGLLLAAGVIPSRWSSYPAALAQALVVLPLLVVATIDLYLRPQQARFWFWAAAVAAAVFGLGRTLAPNYLTLMALMLALGYSTVRQVAPSTEAKTGPRAAAA